MSCCINNNCPPCASPKNLPSNVRTCFTHTPGASHLLKSHEKITGEKLQATRDTIEKLRAAFLKGVQWDQGKTIKIGFYRDKNYSEHKAGWTKQVVEKYLSPLINLKFDWDAPIDKAEVRITFDPSLGAWSAIGTQTLDMTDGATMNLGWLDDDTNYDFEQAKGTGAVIVHEFGHLLGMIHEHSRADADLPWNCDAVYKSLGGPPNNWDKEKVNENVFEQIPTDQFNGSKYDPKSIMHYYFEPAYFCGNVTLPHNTKLSELDIEWISKMYGKGAEGRKKINVLYIILAILVVLYLVFIVLKKLYLLG